MTTDGEHPTPEDLARHAQTGSPVAFARLVDLYQGPLYRFLLLRTRSAADAEELAHDTFVRAWRHMHHYRRKWRFSTWLFTIARRETASFYRDQERRAARHATSGHETPEGSPEPLQTLCDAEHRSQLWATAARVLNEDQRSALWLRYAEDMPPREIARTLGRRPAAVRVLLFRARRTLGRHLAADERAAVGTMLPIPAPQLAVAPVPDVSPASVSTAPPYDVRSA